MKTAPAPLGDEPSQKPAAVVEIRQAIRQLYESGVPNTAIEELFAVNRVKTARWARQYGWKIHVAKQYRFDGGFWFQGGNLTNPKNPALVIKRGCKALAALGWGLHKISGETGVRQRVIARLVGVAWYEEPIMKIIDPVAQLEDKMLALLEKEDMSLSDYKLLSSLSMAHFRAAKARAYADHFSY